ncbi:helix-turn-helix domain-containing protein [Tenacibaculum maritimum]|uniref:helix-turn-helix domain-containing protein n=1 Tax=Tenacibaculum maritimum TaxID=107401 RepID=UPI001E61538A|nr:helix-turn-helix transcriptional regulator [Tenacibaculum maritimum]MCD9584768.1 helix-turn-helix domain-containing protein [Tenacibaculum maritimum]MCD9621618.1 helix-turn-helix domain-containing protein [Tenacibaculum maritimum]MCD9626815.1 helix-turn-helix domain-containing protein [Tenacibaculum maritimum]MCD9630487.1 helix-turn-helix domain-containing protein [Tenacibaculum maritimum]MCD9633755.1 helix-turn-helix domain-containing protein [Tenacibaculum maritimum]
MSEELKKIQVSIQKKIGRNIQTTREKKGLSQVDLAGKMMGKFDTTNISRIESGRTNPTLFTLYRISEALEVPLSEIMTLS